MPPHLMDSLRILQPLELLLARFTELKLLIAGDQFAQHRRNEDLVAIRFRRDPCREDHIVTKEVLLLADHLTSMQSDPDLRHPATGAIATLREIALDRDRTADRAAGAAEGDHESVALRFDLKAAVRCQVTTDDRVVTVQQLEPPLVTELLGEHRRAFDVGEHDRDRAVGCRDRAQVGPVQLDGLHNAV